MVAVTEPLVASYLFTNVLFYPLLVLSAVLAAYYYYQQQTRFVKLGNEIPGPQPLPFVGSLHELASVKTPNEIMERALVLAKPFEKIVKVWLGPKLIVFLVDPSDVEVILSSNVHLDKSPEYRMFQPWFGNGLLISSGDTWRNHRKLIAPAFHLNVLKSFLGQLNSNSRVLVERLRKEQVSGKAFDIHEYAAEITVDMLLETVMGVNRKEQNASTFDYAMAVMRLCDIIHQRTIKIWYQIKSLNNTIGFGKEESKLLDLIHDLSGKVFKAKKEEYLKNKLSGATRKIVDDSDISDASTKGTYFDQTRGLKDDLDDDVGEKKRLPFLELLIDTNQNGGPISEKEIKNQVDTIMFEGHDTVAAGSSFIMCTLGAHPEVQDKVMEELHEIFGDSDRPATFNDTLQMKYLERVILETLRMFPPVPIIARKINQEVKLPSGYTLPIGCTCVIATYKIHRRPDFYPDPEVFNPDNFLPENMNNRPYYAFIPFSAGPRSCVGRKYAMLKLKVMISTVLRNYRIVSEVPQELFKLQADIILKRSDGFRIRLEPRAAKARS
ncbi:cytochrome P450 4g15-like [Bacillus rossius redtenbacheri]|uniref:cytochrome P450 4g15-like n=1 Tax=Bacillus rossius redtenbacheri TaxID=93214 RepID=UPI002FDCC38F